MSDRRLQQVLVIAYAFPPAAYVGVLRTLKYCRFLPDAGWLPTIVTIDASRVAHQDPALLAQVPRDIVVRRTWDPDPAKWLERRSPPSPGLDSAKATDRSETSRAPRSGTWGALRRITRQLLTESPDSHILWIPFALGAAVRVLLRQQIDVIYCSAPPHSSDITAALLGTLFRKPYVLDYRDPWIIPTEAGAALPVRFARAVLRRIRSVVIRRAARIIAISPGERDELRAQFPDVPADRFTYITNGFDPADFPVSAAVSQSRRRFRLAHAGTIYPGAADEFFEAIHRLMERNPAIADQLEIVLIGDIPDVYRSDVAALERAGILRALGSRTHASALQHMCDSDALLILLGSHSFPPSEIPAKTFEYLYARKPILAVAPEGDLGQVLRMSGLGTLIPPHDSVRLANVICEWIHQHANGQLKRTPDEAYIQRFARSVLTARLASVLQGAARRHGAAQQEPPLLAEVNG